METMGIARTYTVLLYGANGRDYVTQDIPNLCHEEAIATARALAKDGRVDLWLGNAKVGSFPPSTLARPRERRQAQREQITSGIFR